MNRTLRLAKAFPTMLRVGFMDAVAYRAEFIVWALAYTMPIIMLALWSAVARDAPVGRFGEKEFQAYFAATLIVRLASGAWVVWDMNMDVRQGTLQKRLMRPVHPLAGYLAENMSALPMRFVIILPITIGALIWLGTGILSDDWLQLVLFPLSVINAFMITFFAMTCIGSLAFYWESSLAVLDVWLGFYSVFSGYVMPLELFPAEVQNVIRWLPFRQMLAFPVENVLGLISRADSLRDLGLQCAWVVFFFLLSRTLWARGVRRFAAFGG